MMENGPEWPRATTQASCGIYAESVREYTWITTHGPTVIECVMGERVTTPNF